MPEGTVAAWLAVLQCQNGSAQPHLLPTKERVHALNHLAVVKVVEGAISREPGREDKHLRI